MVTLRYSSGRVVMPGDVVTGTVDWGRFPAEPFLAQVVDIWSNFDTAGIVFLKRSRSLEKAGAFFRRQSRIAKLMTDMQIEVIALTLRARASQPLSKDVAAYEVLDRIGRMPWGPVRSFGVPSGRSRDGSLPLFKRMGDFVP